MARSWHDRAFAELTVRELYAIIALRERVFVVEQNCVYLDADGADPQCRHLWAEDETRAIHAYCRLVPAGVKFSEAYDGRDDLAKVNFDVVRQRDSRLPVSQSCRSPF